jgi:hypothetical protein
MTLVTWLTFSREDDIELDQDFFNTPEGDFQTNMGMFHNQSMPNVDPSQVWQNPGLTPNGFDAGAPRQTQPVRKSALGNIVSSRDQVVEQFGQITPPEEDKSDSVADSLSRDASESKRKREEEDIAKQNRTQRARNAANKRHSKSKTARRDSTNDVESDGTDSVKGQSKSTNVQREKNRLAAAKCRAKKKATSEDMQETHREGSQQNSYLHREMRELRDQKAFLRNSLLQHEPGVCQCHAIHRFNFAQAQQLAMGVGAMIGQPLSPSQESAGSAMTPGSDSSLGMQSGVPSRGELPRRMSMSSRPQSFNNGSNFNIGQVNRPETYPAPSISPDQSAPVQFADFLQSSPNGGRGGFS